MIQTRSIDLFISYAADDEEWVEGFLIPAVALPRERILTQADFRPGVVLADEFEGAVSGSRYTLLVLSPAYLSDRWAQFSESLASHARVETQQSRLLPLMRGACVPPQRINCLVQLDCTGEDPARWTAEIARLRTLLGRPEQAEERIPCPYPGMVPYTAETARHFHGREAEIEQLLQMLRNQRLVFVIGPSGSGKSSLVAAGLLPRLAESGLFPAHCWLVRTMRPGGQPMQALGQLLGGQDLSQPGLLVEAALGADEPPRQRLLLWVDQLEELFTQAPREEQQRFIATLKALQGDRRCTLLLSMRADFFPDLMTSDLWPVSPGQRFEVAPLKGDALRQAIRQPAEDAGVYLEVGLVERLLRDAAEEPGVLPLLQEAMVLLWEKRVQRLLPLAAYERLGRDGRSGLAVAMAAKADGTLVDLSPEQQAMARRIFVRLVQFGEGRTDTRRRQPASTLRADSDNAEMFQATLRALTESRLLTLSGEKDGKRQVDISHEALISGWPLLGEWLREQRQAEQERRHLESQAANWVALDRRGGLLDDVELGVAQRWLASEASHDLGHSPALLALVQASQAELDGARSRAEEVRQKELSQARELARAQTERADLEARRAGEQAAAARSLRARLWLVVALSVAAGLAAGGGLWSYQRAQRRLVELYQEKGLGELQRGKALTALLYLSKAYSEIGQKRAGPILRTLLHEAARPADALLLTLEGHGNAVVGVAYSPDGTRIATASWDKTARVWDAASGKLLRTLAGHEDMVIGVAYSPDGTRIATTSEDKTARVWDVASGELLRTLKGHEGMVIGVAYSPDGKRIVTASNDRTARVWDAASGDLLRTLEGHEDHVIGVAYSPDGTRIVTASNDKTARVWGAASGELLWTLKGHEDKVFSVAYSPDGMHIVTASDDKTARVWDAASGESLLTLRGHEDKVNGVAYSPDGTRIATASLDKTARVWDAASGKSLLTLEGHEGWVFGVAYSPDGTRIVTTSADTTARVWDAASGKSLLTLEGHGQEVPGVAYSPDGTRIATASWDSTARIWEAASGKVLQTLKGHEGWVFGVAYSPDGTRIATASLDNTARVWDAASGKVLQTLKGHEGWVFGVAYSPDGTRIVTASHDRTARVWEAASGKVLRTLEGHGDGVNGVAYSPDGTRIVTASSDHTARVWEAASGKSLLTLEGHGDKVYGVAYSPDGTRIVTASDDKTARIWDVASGKSLLTLEVHGGTVYGVAYSPDGKRIATASDDKAARVWDAASGVSLLTLEGHGDKVNGVAFSPDGARLVTASSDHTARVWDVGRELRSPEVLGNVVRCHALHRLDEEGRLQPARPSLKDCPSEPRTTQPWVTLFRARNLYASAVGLRTGNSSLAESFAEQALAISADLVDWKESVRMRLLLGQIARLRGDSDKARAESDAARVLFLRHARTAADVEIVRELANVVYEEIHDPVGALLLYDHAYTLAPHDSSLLANRAETQFSAGDFRSFFLSLGDALKEQNSNQIRTALTAYAWAASLLSNGPDTPRRAQALRQEYKHYEKPEWTFDPVRHALQQRTDRPQDIKRILGVIDLLDGPKTADSEKRLASFLQGP